MHRIFKFSVLILSTCLCLSCATIKDPTVQAYRKVLVLLHIKNPADFATQEASPQVCLLDPASMIPQQSGHMPSDDQELPSVELSELAHDFGQIKEDGDYVHHFRVKNTGGAMLNIQKILPG
jgi:hypothetical protein